MKKESIMNNSEAQLEAVELSIENATKNIARMESLQKLTDNKEFNTIVLEGYFKDEASRLVLIKADPNMQDDVEQKSIDNQIIAIGHVRQYFGTIMQIGTMSAKALNDDMETREEILAGDA